MKQKPTLNLRTTIHSIRRINDLLTELIIYSPRLIKNIDIGEFIKFQNYDSDDCYLSEPVPLTPVYLDYENNLVHFVIKEAGASTRILSNLKIGEEVVAMGPLGEKFPMEIFENKKVLMICQNSLHYVSLFLVEKIFDTIKTANITLISNYLDNIDSFYRDRLCNYVHHQIDFMDDNEKFDQFIEKVYQNFNVIILGAKNLDLRNIICDSDKIVVCMRTATMQCMMNGLCGRCIQIDENGKSFFACGQSRYFIYNKKSPNMDSRMKQASLTEKISHIKAQILISNQY